MSHERDVLAGQGSCFSKRGVSGSGSGRGGAPQKRRPPNGDAQSTIGSCCRPDPSLAGERRGDIIVAGPAAAGCPPAEGKGRSAGCHLPRRHERQHKQQQQPQRQNLQRHSQRLGGRGHVCSIDPRAAVHQSAASRPNDFGPEAEGAQIAGGGGPISETGEYWRAKVRCRISSCTADVLKLIFNETFFFGVFGKSIGKYRIGRGIRCYFSV